LVSDVSCLGTEKMFPSECLREIGLEAIRAVHPDNLVRPFVRLRQQQREDDDSDGCVIVDVVDRTIRVDKKRGCHVVGFGKAVLGMAAELNRLV